METYVHRVQYYETDKMGCVHHSNYIRWMEEARVDFLEQQGVGFPVLEARGIYSPVVGVECRYRRPTYFDQRIRISLNLGEFTGIRLRITYEMHNEAGVLVAAGASEHCFTDTAGHPISLKKEHPDLYAALCNAMGQKPEV